MAQASIATGDRAAARFTLGINQIRAITVIACWAVWELVANSGLLYKDVVPSSFAVVAGIYGELTDGVFYYHLGITMIEAVVGFIAGGLIGLLLGIVLGANPFARKAMTPYINALGSTPKIIFLPIIFLIFGVGIESKMAKGALSAFFPIVFSTILGMLSIRQVLLDVGRTFNLTRRQMVTKIYLPAMVNPVIVGARIAMGVTMIGILVAEIKFSAGGLGFRMIDYYEKFEIAEMYAMLIIIFGLAALANWGMTLLQLRYSYNRGADGKKRSAAADLGMPAS